MDWMRNARPSVFAAFLVHIVRKRLLRYVIGYVALISLLVYAELKIGFFEARPCHNGAFLSDKDWNDTIQERNYQLPASMQVNETFSTPFPRAFRLLPDGWSVDVGDENVYIPTAIRQVDKPRVGDFTIHIHAWIRNFSAANFSCCFLRSLNDDYRELVTVRAQRHKHNSYLYKDVEYSNNLNIFDNDRDDVDNKDDYDINFLNSKIKKSPSSSLHYNNGDDGNRDRLKSNFYSSEFYCTLTRRAILESKHIADFKYVTFTSRDSCSINTEKIHKPVSDYNFVGNVNNNDNNNIKGDDINNDILSSSRNSSNNNSKSRTSSASSSSGRKISSFSASSSSSFKNVPRTRDVVAINSPEKMFRSVGLCVSLSASFVNAEYFLEWVEWYRMHGVNEIYFYSDQHLHRSIRRVLDYYEMVGFSKRIRLKRPAMDYSDGVPGLDSIMAANDCRVRMSHFDYSMVVDVTELFASKETPISIYNVLKNASTTYPNAAVFQLHSYQIILDWRPSKKSPLHLARHELRSTRLDMGEDDKLSRWAFIPQRTHSVSITRAWPKLPYTSNALPKEKYTLLRFTRCHPTESKHCQLAKEKVKEKAISRYQNALITAMREVPINYILKYNRRYVTNFHKIRIPGDQYNMGPG